MQHARQSTSAEHLSCLGAARCLRDTPHLTAKNNMSNSSMARKGPRPSATWRMSSPELRPKFVHPMRPSEMTIPPSLCSGHVPCSRSFPSHSCSKAQPQPPHTRARSRGRTVPQQLGALLAGSNQLSLRRHRANPFQSHSCRT